MTTDLLMPKCWDEYRGQDALKTRLDVHIQSSVIQGRTLPPVLLAAPAGYGKTTMATLIARRLEKKAKVIEMPFTPEDLRDLSMCQGQVLVLDEIHRLKQDKQEELLPLLDVGRMKPKGKPAINLIGVPIIMCTTEKDRLIDPLRDRAQIQPAFEPYTDDELGQIVADMSETVGLELEHDVCVTLAKAAGGVPRKAGHLVLAAHDLLVATHQDPSSERVLEFCNMLSDGLTPEHVRYMRVMWDMSEAVGLNALKNVLDMNENQVRDVERLVIRLGYVMLTSRGRELTEIGGERCREIFQTGRDSQ